jgi:predicted O-methyltransferase YrrM
MKLRRRPDTGSMTSDEELDALRRHASEVVQGCIVEVGSYRGRSAIALAEGVRQAGREVAVFAIDPQETFVGVNGGEFGPEDRGAFYEAMLATEAYREVRLVNLPGVQVARAWEQPVGMLFIDGDHRPEAVRADYEAWLPYLLDGAVVAFDDMQNKGPREVAHHAMAEGALERVERVGKVLIARRRLPR